MAAVSFSSSAIASSPTTTTAFWRAGQPEGSRQILPARLIAVAKNPGGRLDPLDYRHPIVQKFRGQEKAQLLQSPIDQYFKVKLLEADPGGQEPACPRRHQRPSAAEGDEPQRTSGCRRSPAEVVLALSNGDPLIVAQSVRRGRVVLVTTSADASWGLLPKWGTYEPLVKEILAWCTAGQAQPRNVAVGDPLESALAATPALASVSIERPGGQRRTVPLEVQGDYSTWRYDDTLISGIYTAHFAVAPGAEPALCGQPDDRRKRSDADLPRRTAKRSLARHPAGLRDRLARRRARRCRRRPGRPGSCTSVCSTRSWCSCSLETLLAWRFGYNAR